MRTDERGRATNAPGWDWDVLSDQTSEPLWDSEAPPDQTSAPRWDWDARSDQISEPLWTWEWDDQPLTPTSAWVAVPHRSSRWLALLVPVCAVAPWFVPWPWQNVAAEPTSDPSSVIVRALAQAGADTPPSERRQGPTDSAVTAMTRQVAASAAGYDVPVGAAAGVKTTPGPYQRVGRIRIPRVGLDVSYGEGVYAKTLERGPGHWPGTPLPGEPGNSVLSGHRNTHTQPFKQLDRLRPGDKVEVSVGSDDPVTFRVDDTTIVPEAQFKDFVLRQPKDLTARQVTMFACHPEGNPIFRIVVRASVRR